MVDLERSVGLAMERGGLEGTERTEELRQMGVQELQLKLGGLRDVVVGLEKEGGRQTEGGHYYVLGPGNNKEIVE